MSSSMLVEELDKSGRKDKKNPESEYDLFVVPWINANQFKKVYEYLFSPEIVKKKWALDQISVWETRCHPSLPAAIDASYGLTSAIVQDILWTNSASVNQQLDIQYLYSSAITRFVNVTVDVQQNRQGNMSNSAKGLGIPSYIIDLRNEASHSLRPSLSCLRIAADASMKYLKESYWDIEAAKVQNYIQKPINVSFIGDLLHKYIMHRLNVLYAERKNKEVEQKDNRLLIELKNCIRRDKRLFIKVLVTEDHFIPNDDGFKAFMNYDGELELFQSDEDPVRYITHNDASIIPDVPILHEVLWMEVISLLNKYDAVPLFLETLLKTQGDRTVAGQKLLISWAMLILRLHTVGGYFVQSQIKQVFKRKTCVINWHSMFYAAVANPCKYTAFLLSLIFCNLDLKRGVTQRVLNLLAILLGQAKEDCFRPHRTVTGAPRIFTVDQLKRDKNLQKIKRRKMDGSCGENIWSLVSDDAYRKWPIGHVINPVAQEENAQTEEDSFDLDVNDDIVEKFILIDNENDNEEDEEECTSMDTDSPDTLEADALKEISKRKYFLYKK